eukprot:847192-Alexandrium_andersonii.AAC.1
MGVEQHALAPVAKTLVAIALALLIQQVPKERVELTPGPRALGQGREARGMEVKALSKPGAIGFRRMQGGFRQDAPCACQLPDAQQLRRKSPPGGKRDL